MVFSLVHPKTNVCATVSKLRTLVLVFLSNKAKLKNVAVNSLELENINQDPNQNQWNRKQSNHDSCVVK